MAIIITSADAERIAKSFNDLSGPKGLNAIRRRAVNAVGSKLRKETRSLAGVVFGASASALVLRGQAASPGSDNPRYTLKIAAKIPIAKLKAAHRKVTTRRGKKSLIINTLNVPAIKFRSIRREGSRFILLQAGPLPARGVGGVYTNAKNGLHSRRISGVVPASPRGRTGLA